MPVRVLIWIAACWMLYGCGESKEKTGAITLSQITMPTGQVVKAELMIRREDMMSGMMFRAPLAEDRGLLFVHSKPAKVSYWMYNVSAPLDIIWMDSQHKIVEMSLHTPPCKETDPVQCPHYGGTEESQFVLELKAGMAEKYGLRKGVQISF